MNAPVLPPAPAASARAPRHDGWTPDRRRTFLESIAEGHTVEAACAHVGLSPASAYALRRRGEGAAFALGWRAASLLAREALADRLTSRAIDGQVDTYTRADGSVLTRHRHDNRLAMAMLARLDRLAEMRSAAADTIVAEPAGAHAARLAAGDFDRFLDMVETAPDADALDDFVGRAESLRTSQLSQLNPAAASAPAANALPAARHDEAADEDAEDDVGEEADEIVWFDDIEEQWLTRLPPPPGFRGEEFGRPGDPDYARALSRAERALAEEDSEALADRLARAAARPTTGAPARAAARPAARSGSRRAPSSAKAPPLPEAPIQPEASSPFSAADRVLAETGDPALADKIRLLEQCIARGSLASQSSPPGAAPAHP